MSHRSCFVVPAAGRGSRLGAEVPKLLVPVGDRDTIWSLLYERMRPLADHVHVVLSPQGAPLFAEAARAELRSGAVSFSIQPVPRGMGDAIFGEAQQHWGAYDDLFVLWGDQLGISPATLARVMQTQQAGRPPCLTLPLTWQTPPYVQYRFVADRLDRILQSREGDACDAAGFSDVGLFGLTRVGLSEAWAAFAPQQVVGRQTGEANFLPFLAELSSRRGWPVQQLIVADAAEARGVNTLEDLEFFRRQRSPQGAH